MIVSITLSQLLECRRIAAGLNFSRADCSLELIDGIDPEAGWAQQMRHRYATLLLTADPVLLPTADVSRQAALNVSPCGIATLMLPSEATRLLNVRLLSWERPALPMARVDFNASGRAAASLNPFCAPGTADPAAVVEPSGHVTLMPAQAFDTVASAIAVVRPADPDVFTLDESLIEQLLAP